MLLWRSKRRKDPNKIEKIVVGPPLPDGNWEVTPRPADALDDAQIRVSFHAASGIVRHKAR
jgi:hypothetical protein